MIQEIPKMIVSLSKDFRMWLFCLIAAVGTFAGHYNDATHGSPTLGMISIGSFVLELAVFYWALKSASDRLAGFPPVSAVGLFAKIYFFRARLLLLATPIIGLFFFSGGFERITEVYTAHSLADGDVKSSFTLLMIQSVWPWFLVFWFFLGIDFLGRAVVLRFGNGASAIRKSFQLLPKLSRPLLGFLAIEFLFFFSDLLEVYVFPGKKQAMWITPLCLSMLLPLQFYLQAGGTLYLAKLIRAREQDSLR